jgi:hypothetical protein
MEQPDDTTYAGCHQQLSAYTDTLVRLNVRPHNLQYCPRKAAIAL